MSHEMSQSGSFFLEWTLHSPTGEPLVRGIFIVSLRVELNGRFGLRIDGEIMAKHCAKIRETGNGMRQSLVSTRKISIITKRWKSSDIGGNNRSLQACYYWKNRFHLVSRKEKILATMLRISGTELWNDGSMANSDRNRILAERLECIRQFGLAHVDEKWSNGWTYDDSASKTFNRHQFPQIDRRFLTLFTPVAAVISFRRTMRSLSTMLLRPIPQIIVGNLRFYTSSSSSSSTNLENVGQRLLECYRILELPQTCTKDELKSSYLNLAKRFHPDTGGSTANADSFRRLYDAYKFIVDNDYGTNDREELRDLPKVFDIRHTAPQHRQYLEFGGVGHGTPSQRQRQYQQHRVTKANEHVNEYMVNKLMANEVNRSLVTKTAEEREYARKWKTRTAVDRLVEDLIQESMRRGEFENLSGRGKPLAYETHNPYVDAMTHKLNQVLIQNGFCPEWVLMEKEVRGELRRIKESLVETRRKIDDDPYYAVRANERQRLWTETTDQLRQDCIALNKRIDSFNLLVPSLHKQMVHVSLDREIKRVLLLRSDDDGGDREKSISDGTNIEEESSRKNSGGDIDRDSKDSTTGDTKSDERKRTMGLFRMLFDAVTQKAH